MAQSDENPNDPNTVDLKQETARLEFELKTLELRQKQQEIENPPGSFKAILRNPLIIGTILTALVTSGATGVSFLNSRLSLDVEREKANLSMELSRYSASQMQGFETLKHDRDLIIKAWDLSGGDKTKFVENLRTLLSFTLFSAGRKEAVNCFILKEGNPSQDDPKCLELLRNYWGVVLPTGP